MDRADALRLQTAIDDILDAASAEPDDVRSAMGAVNWGDLGCTEIEGRRSFLHDVPEVIVAIIEEASPSATGLRDYVQGKLGRADVFIETEW
jgi:hypothetical protein